MNRIYVFPKIAFDRAMRQYNLSDDNVEGMQNSALISIISPDSYQYESHFFTRDHVNVLNLEFDDADPDMVEEYSRAGFPIHLFEKEDAIRIINFVRLNKDKTFFIHCTAGRSRSGAVGFFIRQILQRDYEQFCKDNPKIVLNGFILQMLNDVYSDMIMKEESKMLSDIV
jgi:predicted protein tyrosine phosphatase